MCADFGDRIHRLQGQMAASGSSVAVLSGTDQMRYVTGWATYGHERLVALLVPAEGDPVFLVPAFHIQEAAANSAEITSIVGWSDEKGWRADASEIVGRWNVQDGAIVLVDDELYASHLIGLQELFPGLNWRLAGPTMAHLREV